MAFSSTIAAVLTVLALAAAAGPAAGQMGCASDLIPCADALNSTQPSSACCSAIRQVVTTQLTCLCSLYKNQAALPGINMTQALQIPRRCNISSDVSVCNAVAPTGSSHHPPPAPERGNGASTRDNGASTSSWMGMPIVLLLSAVAFHYN
ncbi:Bifunctional inhibitor/lipid-transfer protein/seed storage 2S albumin superfamily protein [Striga hermonthica]|uniref:Bifunctional inhibitor/lipid-transfer protein/seed storage 2S albumin superfamily protein n=1 Tax=Striga hermonthica TaxID=68872 RepID=A0A9N7RPR4_STRHE|nr:Bifunctional inhibitor/lipid-transfer protein/seed storage 2S albumin superfamily protein [Striga hermonthica]